jgi:hypothetical protein
MALESFDFSGITMEAELCDTEDDDPEIEDPELLKLEEDDEELRFDFFDDLILIEDDLLEGFFLIFDPLLDMLLRFLTVFDLLL